MSPVWLNFNHEFSGRPFAEHSPWGMQQNSSPMPPSMRNQNMAKNSLKDGDQQDWKGQWGTHDLEILPGSLPFSKRNFAQFTARKSGCCMWEKSSLNWKVLEQVPLKAQRGKGGQRCLGLFGHWPSWRLVEGRDELSSGFLVDQEENSPGLSPRLHFPHQILL